MTEPIDTMLAHVREAWKAHPELRLLQLRLNVVDDSAHGYYLEDGELAERLRTVYLQANGPGDTPCRTVAPEDDCPR